MEAIDFDDMPDKHLRRWLESVRECIPKDGFRNVLGLREGAINTALKRIDDLAALRAQNEELKKALDTIESGVSILIRDYSMPGIVFNSLRNVLAEINRTNKALAANSSPREKDLARIEAEAEEIERQEGEGTYPRY